MMYTKVTPPNIIEVSIIITSRKTVKERSFDTCEGIPERAKIVREIGGSRGRNFRGGKRKLVDISVVVE